MDQLARPLAPLSTAVLLDVAVSEEASSTQRLAAQIKRNVRHRTSDGVRNLIVEIRPDGIWLDGHCDTFYCKQLAQHAAMRLAGLEKVINCIHVD